MRNRGVYFKQRNKIKSQRIKQRGDNLPNKEFVVIIIKIFNKHKRMDEYSEKFNEELENIKEPNETEEYNN